MSDTVIVSAVRTAVTKAKKGALKDTRPDDLLACALGGALQAAPSFDPSDLGDVVVGTAMPEGEQGMNVARIAALLSGIPETVPAMTINRFCSSGLQALAQAAACIEAGWYDAALTGGVESMSFIPMGGDRPSPNPGAMAEQPEIYTPMGITSENVAEQFEVSRADQDAFALSSHTKAIAAQEAGRFEDEIVPVETRVFRADAWEDVRVAADDGPRKDTTIDALGRLRPAFKQGGTTTAGNSSQVSDGAAATLLMSRTKAESLGVKPLAVLRGYAVVGVDPSIMGIGPAAAIPAALEKAGVAIEDVDLFEINEAFASQSVYCVRELGIEPDRVNVNGGAIALGHPLGCTGAKLTATLLHEMNRRDSRYGVVSMCIGGGMGAAALFEREA
ncbi:MAG: thiolase family protein [Myxococcota bacterium]|nr:thiolase family protein [Myxococcota bacterium]